ncbi:MAG: CHASE3 domain sensor protein, partial [Arenicella sp.]
MGKKCYFVYSYPEQVKKQKIAFEKKVVIILVAVLLVAISSALFVNNSLQKIVEEISEESDFDEDLVLLKGMMADISDAESNVKSFGLTRDESYLDDYNEQLAEVNQKIDDLKSTAKNGTELEKGLPKIDSLVQTKFEILDELLVVQSERSADQIMDKVLEKVEVVTENSESIRVDENLKSPEVEEDKKKFFDRLFGNRKRKKEEELMAEGDTLSAEDVNEVVSESFVRIDQELANLKTKETQYEVALKLKELELIQKDKDIMDEISAVVSTLELAEEKEMENKIAFAETQRASTRWQIIVFCILSCLLLILAGYAVYIYVRKNKAYQKALRTAKFETDTKNIEITQSINYAKRIQSAIMPDDMKIRNAFPNSFIFYRPKDIVAGDFYWMVQIDGYTFVAVADCTGHGVPGAMVSVACSSALNRSVKEFGLREPSKILDKCREIVIETFDEGNELVFDGMDISLCRIEKNSNSLQYAGANNSLYLVKNKVLQEVKADKQPVARFYKIDPFTNHSLDYSKGDSIYLFTDGYPDQFGGPRQKKFMYKKFKDVIEKNADKSPEDQNRIVTATFDNWKGDL